MSEELVDIEAEVLATEGEVVVMIDREADPAEPHHEGEADSEQGADVIAVEFGGRADLSDHMADTDLAGIAGANVVIFAPNQSSPAETPAHQQPRLQAQASTANTTELAFSREAA